SLTLVGTIPVTGTHAITFSEDGRFLYASQCDATDTYLPGVVVVDLNEAAKAQKAAAKKKKKIPGGEKCEDDLVANPDGTFTFVGDSDKDDEHCRKEAEKQAKEIAKAMAKAGIFFIPTTDPVDLLKATQDGRRLALATTLGG